MFKAKIIALVKASVFMLFVIAATALVSVGCTQNSALSELQEQTSQIRRYDLLEIRYLTTGDYSALQQMKTQYSTETRNLIEHLLKIGTINEPGINKRFLEFYQDTTLARILEDVDKEFYDMTPENEQLHKCFQRMPEILPGVEIPEVYTQIGDLEQSVIVSGNMVGISLDKYLGENYPLYHRYFTNEQRKQMKRSYIVPDCMSIYLLSKFPLKDFKNASQYERDLHIQSIWYVVNKLLGKEFYSKKELMVVNAYLKKHQLTDMTALLSLGNKE